MLSFLHACCDSDGLSWQCLWFEVAGHVPHVPNESLDQIAQLK